METFIDRYNYTVIIVLMMIGLFAMMGKRNLIKKVIGMSIFQSAVIFFFIGISVKENATIPILEHHGTHHEQGAAEVHAADPAEAEVHAATPAEDGIDPDDYYNPLPHVLMLTAIVVGVATLGVALALTQKIYVVYDTLEEDEILEKVK